MNFFCKFLVAAALLLVCQPASAEKRVALVIGNSNYQNAAVLPNPVNDAAAIAATLKTAGFEVIDTRFNLQAADMRRVLRDFADQARDSDIAVVYYAGHGIEMDGTNYLIPTDARLERDTDIYDETFSLDRILLAIEPARLLRLVIVDACRNNPFADTMKRTVSSRSISRGLARVEPTMTNTLVAFAAKAGLTALDGNSKNSPYATALVKYIAQPGLDLRRAFGYVRDDVLQATGNRQEPYVYGSLGGADVALIPAKPVVSTPASPPSEVRQDYELAVQLNNKDALNAFIAQHPDGYYTSLAKLQLAKLAAQETQVATADKAGLAEQGQARLAAEGAKGPDQGTAAAATKAAEEAPTPADSTKTAEHAQAVDAGHQQVPFAAPAAGNASETQIATNVAAPSETTASPATKTENTTNVASLETKPLPADITKSEQIELGRVGCLAGPADGDWSTASQRSLARFNHYAGTKFDTKAASPDALDAIKQKQSRVCPLVCGHGFQADGDHCTKIVCAEGSFLNDDNECEKRRGKTPVAKRDTNFRSASEPQPEPARSPRTRASRSSGQIYCDGSGCRPVQSGCHLAYNPQNSLRGSGGMAEVCN